MTKGTYHLPLGGRFYSKCITVPISLAWVAPVGIGHLSAMPLPIELRRITATDSIAVLRDLEDRGNEKSVG